MTVMNKEMQMKRKYARVIVRDSKGEMVELRDAPIYDEGMSANRALHFGRRVFADTVNAAQRKFEGRGYTFEANIIEL